MTHAAELRTAATRTPDRALAALLATLADAAEHPSDAAVGLMGTVLHPALAVARGIRDTTQETHMPDTTPTTIAVASLKTHRLILTVPNDGPANVASNLSRAAVAQILRHVADQMTPAPARQVLGTTDQQPTTADRRARWEAAAHAAGREVDRNALAVYMAVADAEQAALRAEAEGLDEALRGAIAVSEKDGARLRVDRAAVLREAADEADRAGGLYAGHGDYNRAGAAFALMETYRRMADEAQPATDQHEHTWATVPANGAYAQLMGLTWTRCTTCGQQPAADRPSEARPSETEWVVETLWRNGDWRSYYPPRHTLTEARQDRVRATNQDTDHEYRIVRAETTYTVEPAAAQPDTCLPPEQPCTDPRHTGAIREQFGCNGPDPAADQPDTETEATK